LIRNARENEIPAERIDQQQLKALEPFAAPGAAAIYCSTTAVIDPSAILFRLKEKLEHQGCQISI